MIKKQKLFQIAWQIVKLNIMPSFAKALKAAWLILKINSGFPTQITFAKETGEERKATAIQTGSLDTIASGFIRFIEIVEGKGQWRSFRIENLEI